MRDIHDTSVYEDIQERPVPDFFDIEINITKSEEEKSEEDPFLASLVLNE